MTRKRIILHNLPVVKRRHLFVLALLENVAEHPQHFVRLAVEWVAFGDREQPCRRRALVALHIIEIADAVVAFRDDFLHVPQPLLRFRRQGILGIFRQKRLILFLGRLRFGSVAIGFGHLLVMRVSHLQLRVAGLLQEREEYDEIFVALNGLGHIRRAGLFVVGVGDAQLGFGEIFAVGVGVDQRLQTQPPYFLAPVLDVVESPAVENLVRFGGIVRAGGLIDLLSFLVQDLGVAWRGAQAQ